MGDFSSMGQIWLLLFQSFSKLVEVEGGGEACDWLRPLPPFLPLSIRALGLWQPMIVAISFSIILRYAAGLSEPTHDVPYLPRPKKTRVI